MSATPTVNGRVRKGLRLTKRNDSLGDQQQSENKIELEAGSQVVDSIVKSDEISCDTVTLLEHKVAIVVPPLLDTSTLSLIETPPPLTKDVIELLEDEEEKEPSYNKGDGSQKKGEERHILQTAVSVDRVSSIRSYFFAAPKQEDGTVDLTVEESDEVIIVERDVGVNLKEIDTDMNSRSDISSSTREHRAARMNELYRSRLLQAISRCARANVFSPEDDSDIVVRIVSEASSQAQIVLGRCLFLQGPWFRFNQASRYLQRAGMINCATPAVDELVRLGLLCQLGTKGIDKEEEEYLALLESSVVTKDEVLALLRKFDPKANISETKEAALEKLMAILKNRSTIFGAPQVKIRRLLQQILGSNCILKIEPKVFRVCRRAIMIDHLFLDLSRFDEEDAVIKSGDCNRFLQAGKYRGGCRVPSLYSPGFEAIAGELHSQEEDECDSNYPVVSTLFCSKENLLRLEAMYELHCFAKVLVNAPVDTSYSGDPVDVQSSMGKKQHPNLNHRSIVDYLYETDEQMPTMRSLVELAIHLATAWSGSLQDEIPHHLLPSCDWGYFLGLAFEEVVAWMESQRQYNEAVSHLTYLLQTPVSPGVQFHPRRARWWTRLVINLGHLSRKEEAMAMCHAALRDPSLDSETDPDLFGIRVHLLKHCDSEIVDSESCLLKAPVVHRIAKPFGKAGKGSGAKGKQQFLEPMDSADVTCSVEQFALHLYAEDGGWKGIHTENFALREIFRLLMRATLAGETDENLMAKLKEDMLLYKGRCLDAEAAYGKMYTNRKFAIDARLSQIRRLSPADIVDELRESFETLPVHLKRLKLERAPLSCLQLIAACLGGHRLAACFEMLCKEYRNLGMGGAPDLILFRTNDESLLNSVFVDAENHKAFLQGEDVAHLAVDDYAIKFVEVKSENDRLADRQVAWMNALHARGIPCEVMKIGVTESRTVGRSVKKRKSKAAVSCKDGQDDGAIFDDEDV